MQWTAIIFFTIKAFILVSYPFKKLLKNTIEITFSQPSKLYARGLTLNAPFQRLLYILPFTLESSTCRAAGAFETPLVLPKRPCLYSGTSAKRIDPEWNAPSLPGGHTGRDSSQSLRTARSTTPSLARAAVARDVKIHAFLPPPQRCTRICPSGGSRESLLYPTILFILALPCLTQPDHDEGVCECECNTWHCIQVFGDNGLSVLREISCCCCWASLGTDNTATDRLRTKISRVLKVRMRCVCVLFTSMGLPDDTCGREGRARTEAPSRRRWHSPQSPPCLTVAKITVLSWPTD